MSAADDQGGPGPDRRSLPRPLRDEVARDRLVERLAERWNVALITVVAPGGYGKSVALAQAIRDNDSDPSGLDVYVRLRRSMTAVDAIARAILAAMGAPREEVPDDPVVAAHRVGTLLADRSPTDVAVFLDDVHDVVDLPGVATFLETLLDERPANAHLVLAGRALPALRLARLRAADQLVTIDAVELTMTGGELGALAEHHGVAPDEVTHGWPALARLALAAGPDASADFVMEEVVAALRPELHRALVAACIAGRVDDEMLDAIGCEVSADDVADAVPLVDRFDDGTIAVHDLWHEVGDELLGPGGRAELADRIVEHHARQRRHLDAVRVAIAHQRWEPLSAQIVALLRRGDSELSAGEVASWLDTLRDRRDRPEVALLDAVHARMSGRLDVSLAALQDVVERVRGSDAATEGVVCGELSTLAWLLGRRDVMGEVLTWAAELVERGGRAFERFRLTTLAADADLRGDFRAALDAYERSGLRSELVLRHCSTLAMLCGDEVLAFHYIDELMDQAPKPIVVGQRNALLWQRGDPSAILGAGGDLDRRLDNRRNEFLALVFDGMIRASLGMEPQLEQIESLAWSRTRERTFVTLCRTARLLLVDGEDAARAEFTRGVADIGATDPLLRGEALRYLPYSYVLDPGLREWIDDGAAPIGLGPLHRRTLVAARAFVALREGGNDWPDDVGTAELLTWFPLPWSLEVTCRLVAAGDDRGHQYASWLSDVTGAAAARHLRRLADTGDGDVATGAQRILAAVPAPPALTTRVSTGSPFVVRQGEHETVVGRERVRQTIGLLALRGEQSREDLVRTLWPDTDESKAANTFRTVLRHVRDVLEPDRRSGEASYHVRQREDRIWLQRSDSLAVDLWQIERDLDRAEAANALGDEEAAAGAAAAAFDRWRPDLCADLRDLGGEVALDLVALDTRVLAGVCRSAERRLSDGDPRGAIEIGRAVLARAPFEERAHDVVIGGHLALGDLDAAGAAIGTCLERCADLGVEPAAGTQMLIRRHERRVAAQRADGLLHAVDE